MANSDSKTDKTILDRLIGYCLDNRLVVLVIALMFISWGVIVAPFDWDLGGPSRETRCRSMPSLT